MDDKRTYRSVPEPRYVFQAKRNANGNLIPDLIDGKIPSSQLPGYVDDVIEGYYFSNKFYEDAGHTKEIPGEKGKIYVDVLTNRSYRFSGTVFIVIGGPSIVPEPTALENGKALKVVEGAASWQDIREVPDGTGHLNEVLTHSTTGDFWEKVSNAGITSGNATNGKVLTANGEGGATWENAPTTPVIDNTTSTSTTSALSANMGKVLNDRINYVEARGRFLSVWNATTGQPNDLPTDIATTTYTYRTGDYFIVGVGGNKVPTGTTVPAGTTTATFPSTTGGTSVANDTIVFNGATWDLIHTNIPTVTFGSITGNVSDNTPLTNAFNGKQDTLTTAQLNAVNSGITSGKVSTYDGYASGKQDTITTTNKLSASLVSGLANVATSGSYNDLSNKPTIPTVNDATLTIQKNGTTVDTFTANSSTNKTVNITVPLVDTTYNASSTNAQSGTAVASAIANAITTTINAQNFSSEIASLDSNPITVNGISSATYQLGKFYKDTTTDKYYIAGTKTTTVNNWVGQMSGLDTGINFNAVTYGNDRYVCVGNSGKSYYSTNGTSWIAMSGLDTGINFNAVTYGNGRLVCVGSSGKSYYSVGSTFNSYNEVEENGTYVPA